MALGDLLAQLNPMDYVTGMDRGMKLQQERAVAEDAAARAAMDQLRAEEFARDDERRRRLAETRLGEASARLGSLQTDISLTAGERARPNIENSLVQAAKNIETATGTRGVQLAGEAFRTPLAENAANARAAQMAAPWNFDEMLKRDQEAFDYAGLQQRAQRQDFNAVRLVTDSTQKGQALLAQISGDPANAGADFWDVSEIAMSKTTDPYQRAYIQQQQKTFALQQLAREGESYEGIVKWLPRVKPGTQVRLVSPDTIETSEVVMTEQVDPTTGQRTKVPSRTAGTKWSLRRGDENWIGYIVNSLTGGKEQFIRPNQVGKETSTAASPSDVGASTVRGPGGASQTAVQPPGGAQPTVGARLAAAAPPPPAAGPMVGPPTEPEAQSQEIGSMFRRVQERTARSAQGRGGVDQNLLAINGILNQALQEGRVLSPQIMDQLRSLVGAVAPEAGAVAAPAPAPQRQQTIEEKLRALRPTAQTTAGTNVR